MVVKPNGKDKPPKPMWTEEERKVLKSVRQQRTQIIELPVNILNVDMAYQDRPRERILTQIVTNFEESMLGILVVSQRPDKSYWVMDGETRRQGILARGETQRVVRCEVYQTDGQQQEALLWAWFNSRRSREPIKPRERFVAGDVAGTDGGFGQAVRECGFSLKGGGKRELHGPSYVWQAWNLDGEGSAMRKALFTIKDAWRDKFIVWGYMVLGIAVLYHSQRKAMDEQVRKILQRHSPDEIMEKVHRKHAIAGAKHRIHPDDKPRLIARILADIINKNPGKAGKVDIARLDETRVEG